MCSVNSANSIGPSSGDPEVTIRFIGEPGSERVELIPNGSRTMGIVVNGEDLGLSIRASYAETLEAACEAVISKTSFSTTW